MSHDGNGLSLSLARQVDAVCDRFEEDWQAGLRPRFEAYLEHAAAPAQQALFSALLTVELHYRRDERPTAGDYEQRFPDRVELIQQVFQRHAGEHPAALGEYELLEEIGRGGMGVVYKARQRGTGRLVALKVIRNDRLSEMSAESRARWVERFCREAQAAARMEHPHIVAILHAGEADGRHFHAMRLVEGGSLADQLDDGRPLPERRAAAYLEPVARAVHHAHTRGVLHRDLKPRNILIDGHTDHPLVADFGLVKLLGEVGGPTPSGEVIGSPGYLAPEQVGPAEVTAAADVYGLGATLYHLLTGRPPFQAATLAETLLQALHAEPAPPRQLNPSLSRDLEAVALRCLEKEPSRRYPSAHELAEDLARFLDGKPTRARPVGAPGRCWRWCRRNPVVASLAALSVALLVTVAGVSAWGAVTARAREQEQRQAALMQALLVARQKLPRRQGWSNDALHLAAEAARLGPHLRLRNEAAAALAGLDARIVKQLEGSAGSVALDPSGQRLLLGGTPAAENRPGEAARLWTERYDSLVRFERSGPGPVGFRGDSPLQVLAGEGASAVLWDVARQRVACTGRLPPSEDSPDPRAVAHNTLGLPVLALSGDGRRFAAAFTAKGGGQVAVWDGDSGTLLARWQIDVAALSLARDGRLLAAARPDGQIDVWSLSAPFRSVATLKAGAPVHCLAFSDDASQLAAGLAGGTATIWEPHSGEAVHCRGGIYDVYAVSFSPDGTVLAAGGRDPVKLWDTATGRCLLDLTGSDFVTGLAFSRDGQRLASVCLTRFAPGQAVLWELIDGHGIRTLRGLSSAVSHVAFAADGGRVAALSHSWQLGVWDGRTGRLVRRVQAPRGVVADNAALIFSRDGRQLAFAAGTAATLWDVDTGEVLGSWRLPTALGDRLAFRDDGTLLLFRAEKEGPRRFALRLRKLTRPDLAPLVAEVPQRYRTLLSAFAALDGSVFVAEGIHDNGAGPCHLIQAFDGASGAQRWRKASPDTVTSRVLDGDACGQVLAAYSHQTKRSTLLDLRTGEPRGTLPDRVSLLGPPGGLDVSSVAVRPDTIHGYALHCRGEQAPQVVLGIGSEPAFCPALSPDGQRLAWGNTDGSITLCHIRTVRQELDRLGLGW